MYVAYIIALNDLPEAVVCPLTFCSNQITHKNGRIVFKDQRSIVTELIYILTYILSDVKFRVI